MSDINPIGRPAAPTLGSVRSNDRAATSVESSPRQSDQVELSSAAQLLSRIAELPDVREDVVARVRGEIEAGTYETPDKLDAAIDALLAEEFGG